MFSRGKVGGFSSGSTIYTNDMHSATRCVVVVELTCSTCVGAALVGHAVTERQCPLIHGIMQHDVITLTMIIIITSGADNNNDGSKT